MRKIIDGYKSVPGAHCGSTSMRNLLGWYHNLDLDESTVFGLGAGIDFYTLSPPGGIPMLSGRSVSLELDAAHHLGIKYEEIFEPDNQKAWADVREEILKERPVMLTGDIFYLDYREFKVHFPAHRFVLAGFDDEKQEAYIMDRIRPEYETCSYSALAMSRNPTDGLSTYNLWGRFGSPEENRGVVDLEAACRSAIRTCAMRMLGLEENRSLIMQGLKLQFGLKPGIPALKALAGDLSGWKLSGSSGVIARFNADCIEKFGTGGGMFRNLYTGFLEFVRRTYPDMVPDEAVSACRRSAALWTELASALLRIGDNANDSHAWSEAGRIAADIAAAEEHLFNILLASTMPEHQLTHIKPGQ